MSRPRRAVCRTAASCCHAALTAALPCRRYVCSRQRTPAGKVPRETLLNAAEVPLCALAEEKTVCNFPTALRPRPRGPSCSLGPLPCSRAFRRCACTLLEAVSRLSRSLSCLFLPPLCAGDVECRDDEQCALECGHCKTRAGAVRRSVWSAAFGGAVVLPSGRGRCPSTRNCSSLV